VTENNICNLLWCHATVDPGGTMRPCCRFRELDYKLPSISEGFKEAWTGEVFDDIRARMLAGERLPNCSKCWRQEESTGMSLRTIYNKQYPKALSKLKLRYIEIGFSTHCNLACRICNTDHSSKWATILNPKQSVKLGYDMDLDWFNVDLSHLREIKIVGGEPMMARQHDEFLALLLKKNKSIDKVKLVYYTNGTVLPSAKVIEYWKSIGEVVLYISIDGVGETNTYQRPGSNWQTLHDNVDYYECLGLPNLNIYSHSVITVLNIWDFHNFYDWHSRFIWNEYIKIDITDYPEHLALRNMPPDIKERALTYVEEKIKPINAEHAKYMTDKINQEPEIKITLEEIKQKEKLLDDYFNQRSPL
jgi:radical SAM protein with 4Fe4S-binding SPASM domain